MDPDELLTHVPRWIAASSRQPELGFEIADDLVAIHRGPAGTDADEAVDDIAMVPVAEARAIAGEGARLGPVYRRAHGGGLVVPTGRVLVRFSEGEPAEQHREQLAEAGFDIEQVLAYAPHAAWLRARSGDIADTLAGLDGLAARPGVEHVEPQMLGEVSRRY